MLTIIHVVITVINNILRDVVSVLLKGGAILSAVLVAALIAGGALGISGFGAARFFKRRRQR
jgi:hypothetical protein